MCYSFVIVSQAALDRFSKLKITCSNTKTLKVMDVLGENHDKVLTENKTRIAKDMKAISDAELEHISSGTCRRDPSVILSTCETCQTIKDAKISSHPGFIIAFDNIDIYLERREMTMPAQNRDIHWVNHEMVQNRVSGNNLESQNPKAPIEDVPNITFLPDVNDHNKQRLNYIILISRILVSYFDCFAPFQDVCVYNIPHKYSMEQAAQSVKVLEKRIYGMMG